MRGGGALNQALLDVAETDLETLVAALRRDYSKLSARLRELDHSVACECAGVTLRLHFPAFRQGKATVYELVEAVSRYMTSYALPRSQISALDARYGEIPAEQFRAESKMLDESAARLFKKANELTGRNGECGELLLYLLTEWVLGAPQLIAKMVLKTNPEMPVYGADGVHVRYCAETARLYLYWGEAKLHADLSGAITDAAKSISAAMNPKKMQHEIDLVKRNIDFSGFDAVAKAEILTFLDPMEETYNKRFDVITALIGFNFDAYASIGPTDGEQGEERFRALASAELEKLAPTVAEKLRGAGLGGSTLELFFLPVPSVQELRDLFQEKIGWKVS